MKKMRYLLVVAFLFISVSQSFAQKNVVTGKVYAFKDTPVMNVKIKAKKSKETVTTNERGMFTIEVKDKDKLVFEGDGFRKEVKKVVAGEKMLVKMLFLEGARNEEIAVLSGHLSKESLMYSVSNFLEYNNDHYRYPDIWTLIKGKFPGVKVYEELGNKRVVIRDINYYSTAGENTALYLVDGVIWQDISILTPEEIKTINVMKDGAPLGFRGANGVLVITTVDEYGKVDFDKLRDN